MRRRAFLVLLGPAVVVRPDMVLAQSSDRVRRIGLLMPFAENDSEGALRLAAWLQRLKELGWEDGRNLRIEYRWAAGSADRTRTFAKELVELQPDLLIGGNTTTVATLVCETRKIPIVVVQVADPVGSGLVQSLARPGGNVTGFTNFEFGMGTKWLEVLKEIAPPVAQVAVVFSPDTAPYARYFVEAIEAAAPAVLPGANPAELPMQQPTKFELLINLKTARASGSQSRDRCR